MKAARKKYVKYFRGKQNILDLGCGRGEFLELLKANGHECCGVEIDEKLVEECHHKNLNAINCDIFEFFERFPARDWDGIFIGHIIEHLNAEDALRLIKLASERLRTSGRLIILTPNPNFLPGIAGFWSDMTHVRNYTIDGLIDYISKLNLKIIDSGIDPSSKLRVSFRFPKEAVINLIRLMLLKLIMLEHYSGGEIFVVGELN
jgi:O-antigen chain-terminating methyltransferase